MNGLRAAGPRRALVAGALLVLLVSTAASAEVIKVEVGVSGMF